MWKRLSHKSLTPALNFDLTFCREDPCPHIIIYPHTVSEGLGEYIGKNPPLADRVKLVGLRSIVPVLRSLSLPAIRYCKGTPVPPPQ